MISSPFEIFQIKLLIDIVGFNITNIELNVFLIIGIIIIITDIKVTIVLKPINLIKETIIKVVWDMVKENIGKREYILIMLLIIEILIIMNVIGMISHSYLITGITIILMTISITIWLTVIFEGVRHFGFNYISMFFLYGALMWLALLIVIIEIISFIARAISLGIRLSANITSGHVLIGIISGFIWQMLVSVIWLIGLIGIILMIALTTLELGVAIIQGYVFVLIGTIYLGDGYRLH